MITIRANTKNLFGNEELPNLNFQLLASKFDLTKGLFYAPIKKFYWFFGQKLIGNNLADKYIESAKSLCKENNCVMIPFECTEDDFSAVDLDGEGCFGQKFSQ